MSLRAHLWAMDEAPVKNPTAALVLLALADEANDDGEGACPYMDKLIKRGRCSERSAQAHLRDLFRARLINLGDEAVARRRYRKSGGRVPRVWDLNMSATWDRMPEPRSDEEMLAYSAMIGQRPVRRAADQDEHAGVQDLHPTNDGPDRGVQDLHPTHETDPDQATFASTDSDDQTEGYTDSHPRGATGRTPEVQLAAPYLSVPASPFPSSSSVQNLTEDADRADLEEGNGSSKREWTLDETVAWFVDQRPDWEERYPGVIHESLTAAVNQGLGTLHQAAAALRELAEGKHGETKSPRRLLYADGAWWANVQPKPAPRKNDGPRCRKPGHERNQADACPLCVAEARACRECVRLGSRSCDHGTAFQPEPDVDPDAAERGKAYLASVRQRRAALVTAASA